MLENEYLKNKVDQGAGRAPACRRNFSVSAVALLFNGMDAL